MKEGGLSKFYKDYEVKSLNGRIHYYGNAKHLNFVRDGKKLIERVATNEGFNHSRSWKSSVVFTVWMQKAAIMLK